MTEAAVAEPAQEVAAEIERFRTAFTQLADEVGKYMVGQREVIENVLIATICGGHVLLEGVPGLGKTTLVTTLAKALSLEFKRIQFTPDLLPSDVVGTDMLVERGGEKRFEFQPGPVFCNILLADEINRATPKTQSALLEAMQEGAATVSGRTHRLDRPFFVLATQNPIEQDGTYPLPEAQLDRFFFKLEVSLPTHDEFAEILRRTGGTEEPIIEAVADGGSIIDFGRLVRRVPIVDEVQDHLIRCVRATHPDDRHAPAVVKRFVRHGASPRAAQTILHAARVKALLDGRFHVARADVDAVATPALRHRLQLSFEGEAEGVKTDEIVKAVITAVS